MLVPLGLNVLSELSDCLVDFLVSPWYVNYVRSQVVICFLSGIQQLIFITQIAVFCLDCFTTISALFHLL